MSFSTKDIEPTRESAYTNFFQRVRSVFSRLAVGCECGRMAACSIVLVPKLVCREEVSMVSGDGLG